MDKPGLLLRCCPLAVAIAAAAAIGRGRPAPWRTRHADCRRKGRVAIAFADFVERPTDRPTDWAVVYGQQARDRPAKPTVAA